MHLKCAWDCGSAGAWSDLRSLAMLETRASSCGRANWRTSYPCNHYNMRGRLCKLTLTRPNAWPVSMMRKLTLTLPNANADFFSSPTPKSLRALRKTQLHAVTTRHPLTRTSQDTTACRDCSQMLPAPASSHAHGNALNTRDGTPLCV